MTMILRNVRLKSNKTSTIKVHQITNGYGFLQAFKYGGKTYRVMFAVDNKTYTISWDGPDYSEYDCELTKLYKTSTDVEMLHMVGIVHELLKVLDDFYADKLVTPLEEYYRIHAAVFPIHKDFIERRKLKKTAKTVEDYSSMPRSDKVEVLESAPNFKEDLIETAKDAAIEILENAIENIRSDESGHLSTSLAPTQPSVTASPSILSIPNRTQAVCVLPLSSERIPVAHVKANPDLPVALNPALEIRFEEHTEECKVAEDEGTTQSRDLNNGPRYHTTKKFARLTRIRRTQLIKVVHL